MKRWGGRYRQAEGQLPAPGKAGSTGTAGSTGGNGEHRALRQADEACLRIPRGSGGLSSSCFTARAQAAEMCDGGTEGAAHADRGTQGTH